LKRRTTSGRRGERRQGPKRQAGLAAAALADYRAAIGELEGYEQTFSRIRWVALPILVLVLAVFGITALVIGVVRNISQAMPYYVGAAACFILLVGAIGFFLWPGAGNGQVTRVTSISLSVRTTGNSSACRGTGRRYSRGLMLRTHG